MRSLRLPKWLINYIDGNCNALAKLFARYNLGTWMDNVAAAVDGNLGRLDAVELVMNASEHINKEVAEEDFWPGVCQSIKVTVETGADASGTLVVEVYGAPMFQIGSEIVMVEVTVDEDPEGVAEAIRDQLGANEVIADFYTVSGNDDEIILTAIAASAYDDTMRIELSHSGYTGVTLSDEEVVTAGAAPDGSIVIGGGKYIVGYDMPVVNASEDGTFRTIDAIALEDGKLRIYSEEIAEGDFLNVTLYYGEPTAEEEENGDGDGGGEGDSGGGGE
jgi:hypothetical protein